MSWSRYQNNCCQTPIIIELWYDSTLWWKVAQEANKSPFNLPPWSTIISVSANFRPDTGMKTLLSFMLSILVVPLAMCPLRYLLEVKEVHYALKLMIWLPSFYQIRHHFLHSKLRTNGVVVSYDLHSSILR